MVGLIVSNFKHHDYLCMLCSKFIVELERALLTAEMWYENLTDRDCDYGKKREYAQATKYDYYSSTKEYWTLSSIAVLKRYQRNGVGRELMEWGMSIAWKSGLPLALDASSTGRRLYEGLGFRVVEVKEVAGLGLEGVVMVWEKDVMDGGRLDSDCD